MMFVLGFLIGKEEKIDNVDFYQSLIKQGWKEYENWACDIYDTDEFREYMREKKVQKHGQSRKGKQES